MVCAGEVRDLIDVVCMRGGGRSGWMVAGQWGGE